MLDNNGNALGEYLKSKRMQAGISLSELARRLGMPPSTILRIESDGAKPSTARLEAIARELNLDPTEVMSYAGHQHLAELPALPHYLRTKYPNMPDDARDELTTRLNQLADKYGFDPNNSSPDNGQDEH